MTSRESFSFGWCELWGFRFSFLTYSGENGRVVEVVGKSGQHLGVVCVLLLVFHNDIEWQFPVVSADQNGSRAVTQELTSLHLACHRLGVQHQSVNVSNPERRDGQSYLRLMSLLFQPPLLYAKCSSGVLFIIIYMHIARVIMLCNKSYLLTLCMKNRSKYIFHYLQYWKGCLMETNGIKTQKKRPSLFNSTSIHWAWGMYTF